MKRTQKGGLMRACFIQAAMGIANATMVAGIGIDLIETARIRKTLDRFGDRFLKRVYTSKELDYCQSMKNPDIHLAARFAAKEALSKSFGTGIGQELGWKDIEILRDELGKPTIQMHGHGLNLAKKLGIQQIHVSLSHTDQYGCAVVVLEK